MATDREKLETMATSIGIIHEKISQLDGITTQVNKIGVIETKVASIETTLSGLPCRDNGDRLRAIELRQSRSNGVAVATEKMENQTFKTSRFNWQKFLGITTVLIAITALTVSLFIK